MEEERTYIHKRVSID